MVAAADPTGDPGLVWRAAGLLRLRSLVVGSGGAAVPLQLGSRLNDWVQAPDLDRFRRADPRQIVAGALSGIERYLDAGHFTWEHAASQYAALVTTWWTDGYLAASS
jgi:hypothetical protein